MSGQVEPVRHPYFLVGAERSGTTVLRLMLDHHPQIAFIAEFEFVVMRLPDQGWPAMESYRDLLDDLRIFHDTGFTVDPALDYVDLANSFLHQKMARDHKPIVGATVHYDFDKLLRIWPEARFIHLIRDGRDVARSYIAMGWAGNTWTGTAGWVEAETTWERLRERLTPDRYVELTYEDLIRNHEHELGRVCAFMGVSYDPAIMDYTRNSTYGPPDPKLIEQWKRKMPVRDIQLVEARIGEMMAARGYELSGHPRIEVTPDMERRLLRQDVWAQRRFRLQRYGLPLMLTQVTARTLGIRSWQKRVKARINAIDAAHVK